MKKTVVTLIDDLDGSELPAGAKATTFAIDGVEYSIDLSDKNKAKLTSTLAPFIEKATKVTGRGRGRASSGSGRSDLAAVRAWAQENGYDVSPRGRVAREIIAAYDAAH